MADSRIAISYLHTNVTNRCFLLLILLVTLTACGFQLRGEQVLPFAAIAVSGDAASPLTAQLRQAVAAVPRTRLAVTPAASDAELQIVRVSQDRIITALSAAGRVREYELRLQVTYRLVDKQRDELIPTSEILLFRLLPYDESQVLSKGEEEALLYRDMLNDAVAQIMRRIAAVKPPRT